MRNASEKVIFKKGADYTEARILEQWIESKLGIEDKSVEGEVA